MFTWLFRLLTLIIDTVTWPVYFMVDRPWLVLARRRQPRGVQLDPDDPTSPWITADDITDEVREKITANHCNTIDQLFRASVNKFGSQKCLGRRRVLQQQTPTPESGDKIDKLVLTDEYEWISYVEADCRINSLSAVFLRAGVTRSDPVILYADTSPEWFLSAQALFRTGAVMVTLYPNFGLDELTHAFQETQPKFVLAGNKLANNLIRLIDEDKIKDIKTIIIIDEEIDKIVEHSKVSIVSLKELEADKNEKNVEIKTNVKPDDTAFIMYTSGSTGTPKGVILSHHNIISAVRNLSNCLLTHTDLTDWSYVGYLPLAHIFEFIAENVYSSLGVCIGYGRPLTLTDQSPGLVPGQRGDLTILQPTVFFSVPLVMERFKKSVLDGVESKNALVRELFHFALDYKTRWTLAGYSTPFIDFLVFRKIRQVLGGRVKMLLVAGAPLATETEQFMSTVLGINILQGYGSTETCCSITGKVFIDHSPGRVGGPFPGTQLKLVDWLEGGYRVTDQPPRGEIASSGGHVTVGYFKLDQVTEESFVTDKEGRRWFLTGDIGEVDWMGRLKIIDRKHDFVKLQHGEFISLGKIESVLKQSPFVANICVCADSLAKQPVALVLPEQSELVKLVKNLLTSQTNGFSLDVNFDLKSVCEKQSIIDAIQASLAEVAERGQLKKTETPAMIKLCAEEWTPDNGLLTPTMKIVRKSIIKFYKRDIEMMFRQIKLI